ncbi:MAG: N-(5'-phosphoribosyl)anthranilate isomerase [Pirellulaceae bacterium]|nr:MAG: N-(5'-phosphoribosyl)anthranilate isomerase [Pirellulaceae bacterium]
MTRIDDRPRFPRIKVCGVTREQDVVMLAEEGVDTIGINLVHSSPRGVSLAKASKLAEVALSCRLQVIAVVMNPSRDELKQVLAAAPWDAVQLHGQESVDLATNCENIPVIKAVSWSGRAEEREMAKTWQRVFHRSGANPPPGEPSVSPHLWGILIDAYAPVTGGGTGRTARWDLLAPRPAELTGVPLMLAGGLRPDNVAAAIAVTRPQGVDTASGVEESPGIKSRQRVRQFVAAVDEVRDAIVQ